MTRCITEIYFSENLPSNEEIFQLMTKVTGLVFTYDEDEQGRTLAYLEKRHPSTSFELGVYVQTLKYPKFREVDFYENQEKKVMRIESYDRENHYLKVSLIHVLKSLGGNYEGSLPEWTGLRWEEARKYKGITR